MTSPPEPCIFCRILAGELPSSVVFRDERCVAIMDLQPINSGHVLVVPVQHAAHLADLDAATAGHLMIVAQRITAALRGPLGCEGVNLILSDGEAAGQEVGHVHLHVVPRHEDDGFAFQRDPKSKNPRPREQLDSAAAQIRDELAPFAS
jgi:histidine triad (HIT) family protein